VEERPTGQYVRRLWFLHEFLTGRKVPVADASTGNYVPLLDPRAYYATLGSRSRRHRVVNNLVGNADFCPTVRRTDRLAGFEAAGLATEAARIVADFDEDAIRRAVSCLYTKETRSSFDIEGERPSASRTERYVSLLRAVPNVARLTREELLRLRNATVDPRYADHEYRSDQVYVGEQVDLARQRIHFVAACPGDVPRLMEGLLNAFARIEGSGVDPIVLAAALSFGFVFIHPFQDGNGRLHRPDRKANLFIKLCLRNAGKLSPGKRRSHFGEMKDGEVTAMESAVQKRLGAFRGHRDRHEGDGEQRWRRR